MIVASFLIAVVLIVFISSSSYKYQDAQSMREQRIRSMNDFVRNLNSDIHRSSYISAFRTLVSLEDHVTSTSTFLNDSDASFRETFFYGTINGTQAPLMANSSFSDYLVKVRAIADSVGINLDINVTHITLNQSDPWSIDVHIFATINMTDVKRLSSYYYSREFVTNVPIYDLRDPLYGKYTLNKVPNTIRRLNVSDLVIPVKNATNLVRHINGSYYIASTNAPSILMRFEGKNTSSIYGIESIVNIRSLSDQDIDVFSNHVKVDYIYFMNLTSDKLCNVENVDTSYNFVIPSNRIALYNLSLLNYTAGCP